MKIGLQIRYNIVNVFTILREAFVIDMLITNLIDRRIREEAQRVTRYCGAKGGSHSLWVRYPLGEDKVGSGA